MPNEIMSPDVTEDLQLKSFHQLSLSAITVQAMAALGYEVAVDQADPYTLPAPGVAADRQHGVLLPRGWGDLEQRTEAIFDESGRVVSVTRHR